MDKKPGYEGDLLPPILIALGVIAIICGVILRLT
jgi:hypothetical protein